MMRASLLRNVVRKASSCPDGSPAWQKNLEHPSLLKTGFSRWDLNLHTVIFCVQAVGSRLVVAFRQSRFIGPSVMKGGSVASYLDVVLFFVTPLSPALSRIESGCSMLTELSQAPGLRSPPSSSAGGSARPHNKHPLLSLHHLRRPPTSKKSKYAENQHVRRVADYGARLRPVTIT